MNAHDLELFQVLTPEQQEKVGADGTGRGYSQPGRLSPVVLYPLRNFSKVGAEE